MKNFGGPVSRKQTYINITSLIDVIFVLIIFFMISASFEKPAISVSLPSASSGEPGKKQTLLVSVDADGIIYLEGTVCTAEELLAKLTQLDREVSLECDERLPFQAVMGVMDIIKKAGVRNMGIRYAVSH